MYHYEYDDSDVDHDANQQVPKQLIIQSQIDDSTLRLRDLVIGVIQGQIDDSGRVSTSSTSSTAVKRSGPTGHHPPTETAYLKKFPVLNLRETIR